VTGLDRMTHYWDGIAWIAGTIKQRLAGEDEIDLAKITADLENCVVSGDPGAIAEMSDPGPKPLSGPAAAAVATPAPQPWAAPYQYTAPSGDNGLFDPSRESSFPGHHICGRLRNAAYIQSSQPMQADIKLSAPDHLARSITMLRPRRGWIGLNRVEGSWRRL